MSAYHPDHHSIYAYALLLVGFVLLAINHFSVVMGDPWLIPTFLRLY